MTETKRLVAIGPGTQFYGTRALVAGDQFELPRQYADVLILLGKAKLAEDKPPEPKPAEPKPKITAPERRSDDLNELRAEASRMGIVWDGRWGVDRLKHEIGLAKSK